MNYIAKLIISAILIFFPLHASIVNTKHNLSVTGTGNIKAKSEKQICIFCHTPHAAREGKPLWNRKMSDAAYTMYSSTYIDRLNYPKPTGLGKTHKEPGVISRQCLSCHDGTIALGSVYVIRGTILGDNLIDINNAGPGGVMPSGIAAHFGTDLSMHHPVGYEYNPNVSINFGTGSKSSELKPAPDTPIKTYRYGSKDYIECSSCHDPHINNKKFLRVKSGSNHGQNIRNTCISCHDKSGGDSQQSAHETIVSPYRDNNVQKRYDTSNPNDLFCINCHTPHHAEGASLLRKIEQNTCFQGAASSSSLSSCHGTGASGTAPDIQSVLSRPYGHPVSQIDNIHTNLDVLYGTGVSRNPAGSKGLSWNDSKHAECADCHNPHKTRKGSHVPDGQWYPSSPNTNTNNVSNALREVSGIEPNWSSRWTQPTSFSTLISSQKEYQICLKCHSYWSLGNAVSGVSSHFLARSGINATDQAWEFNPNNRSAHPVVVTTNSMPGSYAPKALSSSHMLPPWKNVGMQTMYCSDCHGADNEIGGDPRGPHGSNHKFMLKGENTYWPERPDGTLYTVGDIFDGGDSGLFCKNCHDLTAANVHQAKGNGRGGGNGNGGGGGGGGGSFSSITCVSCHIAVPHGSPVSRLIGYDSFPAPYNYNGNSLKLNGYRKTTYSARSNASSSNSACRCHQRGGSVYDSYP